LQVFSTKTTTPKPLWSAPIRVLDITDPLGNNTFFSLSHAQGYLTLDTWNYTTAQPPVPPINLNGHSPSTQNPIVVSKSGNLIVTAINKPNGAAQINWWDQNGHQGKSWTGDAGFSAVNVFVSSNGDLIILDLSGRIVVLETNRSDKPVFDHRFQNDKGTLCARDDGSFAYGGTKGFLLFQYQGLGRGYGKGIVINTHLQERGEIDSCGLTQNYLVLTLLTKFHSEFFSFVYNLQTGAVWDYEETRYGPGNEPSEFAASNDGAYFAVSNWGNLYQTVPELAVWNIKSKNPVFQYRSLGSLFSVDLFSDGSSLYVVSCGKTVHKTIRGTSGFIVLAKIK